MENLLVFVWFICLGRDGTFGIIDHSVQIERKLKMISGIDNVYIEPAPDHNTGHPPSQIFDGQPDKILNIAPP